jgi:hypothetical protein
MRVGIPERPRKRHAGTHIHPDARMMVGAHYAHAPLRERTLSVHAHDVALANPHAHGCGHALCTGATVRTRLRYVRPTTHTPSHIRTRLFRAHTHYAQPRDYGRRRTRTRTHVLAHPHAVPHAYTRPHADGLRTWPRTRHTRPRIIPRSSHDRPCSYTPLCSPLRAHADDSRTPIRATLAHPLKHIREAYRVPGCGYVCGVVNGRTDGMLNRAHTYAIVHHGCARMRVHT